MKRRELSALQRCYDEGAALLKQGRYADARDAFSVALRHSAEQDQPALGFTIGSYLAIIEEKLGNSNVALELAKLAVEGATSLESAEATFICRRNLGLIHVSLADPSSAEECYKHALAIAREVKNRRYEAIVLADLATLDKDLGKAATAIGFYEEALSVTSDYHERAELAKIIADLYADSGRISEATHYFDLALSFAQTGGSRPMEARALVGKGSVLAETGRYESALSHFEIALAIARETGDEHLECACVGNMGGVRFQLGQTVQAIGYFEEGLRLARKVGDKGHVAQWLADLGNARGQLAKINNNEEAVEKAIKNYDKAIEAAKQVLNHRLIEMCLTNLSALYLKRKEYDNAFKCLTQARESASKRSDKRSLAMVHRMTGSIYVETGEFERAKAEIDQGLSFAQETRSIEELITASYALGRIYEGHFKDLESAHEYYATARKHVGVIRSAMTRAGYKQWLQAEWKDIYDRDLLACYWLAGRDTAYYSDLLEIAEQSKSRVLADTIAQGGLAKYDGDNGPWETEGCFRAISSQSITASEIFESLDASTLLLYFHSLDDRYLLCALIDRSGILVYPHLIPVQEVWDLTADIHIVLNELHDYPTESRQHRLKDCLAKLEGLLLTNDVRRAIHQAEAPQLLIVPDGLLYNMPLHALYDQEMGQYLVDRFPDGICYAPSMTVFRLCSKKKQRSTSRKTVVFANPTLDLPGTVSEVEIIKKHYPELTAFVGQEATIDRFIKSASENDVIWFAGHGIFRPDDPLSSHLKLHDGNLSARTIIERQVTFARNPLLVLSCCEIGQFTQIAGREILGLLVAFLEAGVPSIIAGLWKVEDVVATKYLSAFCLACEAHELKDKAYALKIAADTVRKDPRLDSPYFWAPFYVMGAPRLAVLENSDEEHDALMRISQGCLEGFDVVYRLVTTGLE